MLGYISVAESLGVSSTTFTQSPPRKLSASLCLYLRWTFLALAFNVKFGQVSSKTDQF